MKIQREGGEPKPRKKFPREMMVSDDKVNWERSIVYSKLKTDYPFVGYLDVDVYNAWKYAKEIE